MHTPLNASHAALAGLRILDFSHVYQGPVGTQILADYGADVIKVERPGSGDWSRSWGPFVKDVSLPYANLNRNKRSLTVDMKSGAGKAFIRKLIVSTDVLVHNFRKGVMEKLDLGYDTVSKLNPKLVYAWSSGWGDHGPSADRGRGGHDMMARAEGGWFVHYDPEQPPIPGGMSIDYPAGLNLMLGIMIALYHREKTGKGQFLSTDLLSVAMHGHAWEGAAALNAKKIDRPARVGGTEAAVNKAFATADGFIEISPVFSDNSLRDISLALGLKDLSLDPRFTNETLQIENKAELNAILADRFKTNTTAYWMESLESQDVFCANVRDFATALEDEQVHANGMVVEMNHPRADSLKMLGNPIRMHGTPPTLRKPPPDLGQDSRAVAEELGYTDTEIQSLIAAKIIGS